MKATCLHIFLGVLLAGVLSSCNKDEEIISRADMSRIYADMFVADAWLSLAEPEDRAMADTTAFYEPVFRKYGYTTSDYLASVEYYLNDPGRFSRILRKTHQMLESESASLQVEYEKERLNQAKGQNVKRIAGGLADAYTDYSELVHDAYFTDRVDISMSRSGVYLPSKGREDVSFRGPRMILKSDVMPEDEALKFSYVVLNEEALKK